MNSKSTLKFLNLRKKLIEGSLAASGSKFSKIFLIVYARSYEISNFKINFKLFITIDINLSPFFNNSLAIKKSVFDDKCNVATFSFFSANSSRPKKY